MAKFIKKCPEVDAIIWDGQKKTADDFIGGYGKTWNWNLDGFDLSILIVTKIGTQCCRVGDYVIRNAHNCVYTIPAEHFLEAYSPLNSETRPTTSNGIPIYLNQVQ